MQPIDEIEKSYQTPDPWGYQTNPEDARRRVKILEACALLCPEGGFKKALEIGAGEGWITKTLPSEELHGFEVSMNARKRMPLNVCGRGSISLEEKFDLIVVPGCLYGHYDYEKFFQIMKMCSTNIVVTCNIKEWERVELSDQLWCEKFLGLKQMFEEDFPYREFIQKLRVFKKI